MKPTDGTDRTERAGEPAASPGYVLGQLARAFSTSQTHADPPTRGRAGTKVGRWLKVLSGMLSGLLRVGSRTPVADTPAWATLEVAHGGFATGDLLAAGPLRPHEQELLARLAVGPSAPPRAALNGYYLGDDGVAALQDMLASGRYRVDVPEEGALLVIAWLLARGHAEQARALLDEIAPFLGMLRFYPTPAATPPPAGTAVHLQTVAQTAAQLRATRAPKRFLAQREAALVWAPLCDRAVALFAETVEGPAPSLRAGADGRPLRTSAGKHDIEGGWPCQHYPDGWRTRARALLDDYRQLRAEHRLCGKPERPGQNFALLRGHLETCVQGPERLTGRGVGLIRLVLASVAFRRGLPGSERCRRLRQRQADLAARPTTADLARAVLDRLARLPQDEGVDDDGLGAALAPVTADEAARLGLPPGQRLADRLGEKVRRCLAAPVETLVERGVIPSGEVLARVVPQVAALARAAAFADPDLRRLYTAVYRAFRRRRSLLLLKLQSQVKLEELPWVRAMGAHLRDDLDARGQARQVLEQVVRLAVTAFPQQILPNKLLQEVRALADAAGLRLPVVDEVAADIFMGDFSEKYLRAAQKAGEALQGTLYERYYGVDYDRVRQIDDVAPSRYGTPTSPAFARLCVERTGATAGGRSVARNGTIIEQEQVLTTHNLAVLFDALGLRGSLGPALGELARRCFAWACRRLRRPAGPWKARLRTVKNAAYAWRQMVFFLALLPAGDVRDFLAWAEGHLGEQGAGFRLRFRLALAGLARATQGLPTDGQAGEGPADEARTFLGWATEKHWLLR
jgi:hypothetical protein